MLLRVTVKKSNIAHLPSFTARFPVALLGIRLLVSSFDCCLFHAIMVSLSINRMVRSYG
uniref:Uncharacterized protein n=1 Tax=Rhizophora mucronata TaxID=61149 RepID=A0A2P2P2S8_RHIMU